MDFSLIESTISDWGIMKCKKEEDSEVVGALLNNEVQILGFEVPRSTCNGKKFQFSKGLRISQLVVIVPHKNDVEYVKYEWQVMHALVLLILPILLWILSRLSRFSPKKWSHLSNLKVSTICYPQVCRF